MQKGFKELKSEAKVYLVPFDGKIKGNGEYLAQATEL